MIKQGKPKPTERCHWQAGERICKKILAEFPVVAQWKQIQRVSMRIQVWSLALVSGLRIHHCRELWCRWQTWLGSCIAAAVVKAGNCSSNLIPSLGSSCAAGAALKGKKKKSWRLSLEDSIVRALEILSWKRWVLGKNGVHPGLENAKIYTDIAVYLYSFVH